jgi:hypothetical protein
MGLNLLGRPEEQRVVDVEGAIHKEQQERADQDEDEPQRPVIDGLWQWRRRRSMCARLRSASP